MRTQHGTNHFPRTRLWRCGILVLTTSPVFLLAGLWLSFTWADERRPLDTKPAAAPPGLPFTKQRTAGVPVRYQLPDTPGQTYRVTLAITDAKNPDWIVSTFVAGAARTVTAQNRGVFEETWDGLDDNFMPVPPGAYGVKGIFMAAQQWTIDGAWHSVVPRYLTEASAWRAPPGSARRPIIEGDPVHSPLGDVDIAANGVGVFCYVYLENARNFYLADFKRPIDYDQVLVSYPSGGAAGGTSVATDGTTCWVYENEGFVFRADQKPFGKENGRFRRGVYLPAGYVTAMAAWRDEAAGKSYVYLAQRGKLVRKNAGWPAAVESTTDHIDKVVVLDGATAATLAEVPAPRPLGVVARWGDRLWVLHHAGAGYAVSAVPLRAGLPQGELKVVLAVPRAITPADLEVDSRGRIYLADAQANRVYQFAPDGKPLRHLGRLARQKPGSYDRLTFMAPGRLACWRDAEGRDRLVVVERHGPCRVSEWDPDDGSLRREWLSAQTFANDGYAVDPRQPERLYVRGHGGTLVRWGVNYDSGAWQVEAVWPDVFPEDSPLGWGRRHDLSFPRVLYRGDTRFLAFGRGSALFRESGDRWLPSAAIISDLTQKKPRYYLWHDANGDGHVQAEEYLPSPTVPPVGTMRYWGESWLDDFSVAAIQLGSADVWRLAPESFDKHGNPQYASTGWTKLLTDPILEARRKGTAPALYGGNEVGDRFSSAWGMVAGSLKDGFWVNARGPDQSANFGVQHKLSRYVPDGRGGYRLRWRVGRAALRGTASPGEIYGSIHVTPPIGGLITVIDQSRMGALLYTEDGLYVDTLFADERRLGANKDAGPYTQPGEFFSGYTFLHHASGKVYLAIGKPTLLLFELLGWTGTRNPVRPLPTLPRQVLITAAQIAPAPDFALAVRRRQPGGTTARVARFAPLPGGGPALDGSLSGWESCEPLTFRSDDKQQVEVRCGYDPQRLYLRWHARLGRKFEPKPLAPADRIFTHDRHADTLSFYIQGDPNAAPPRSRDGRAGDARFVFGLFQDGAAVHPAVLAMVPKWPGPAKGNALTYKSPTGTAVFEHVGLLHEAKLGHQLDVDGQGFVIAAALPRAAVPLLPPFTGAYQTQVNFDATFGGHNRFGWSNADGSATRETYDEPTEAHLYPGSWSQAQFEPIDGLAIRTWSAIGPFGFADLPQLRHREDRAAIVKRLAGTIYPPEQRFDAAARYAGDLTQTRRARRELRWRPASISVDVVKFPEVLGWKGYEDEGVAYLRTSIDSPAVRKVKLRALDGHGHHAIHAWLNGQALGELPLSEKVRAALQQGQVVDGTRTVLLRQGANDLLVRYDLIWGDNSLGIRLAAAPEVLWQLRFAPPSGE